MREIETGTPQTSPRKHSRTFWPALAAFLLFSATTTSAQQRPNHATPGPAEMTSRKIAVEAVTQKTVKRRIVISIPDRKLALVEDGQVVKVYPVAVGTSASPSPTGTFKVTHRIPEPTYYAPGTVLPPGPANPLGTRWIGVDLKGYGIHGTNEPHSIGRYASHGCIRMRNTDAEDLFERVRGGDIVEVHGERTAELTALFAPEASAKTEAKVASAGGVQKIPVTAAVVF